MAGLGILYNSKNMLELTPKISDGGGRYVEVFDGQDRILAELWIKEAEALKDYNSRATERYVEIGTKYGGSALLARTVNPNIEVWTIDKNGSEFQLSHRNDINLIKKSSIEAAKEWDKPIDILFIDGDHSKAKEDFEAWQGFVKKDGYIIFHDYHPQESWRVIEDCDEIAKREDYERIPVDIEREFTLFIIKKL